MRLTLAIILAASILAACSSSGDETADTDETLTEEMVSENETTTEEGETGNGEMTTENATSEESSSGHERDGKTSSDGMPEMETKIVVDAELDKNAAESNGAINDLQASSTTTPVSSKTEPMIKVNTDEPAKASVPDHKVFDAMLKQYVTADGRVNYKGFKAEASKLQTYLDELSAQNPNNSNWSSNEKYAFWINAYNAFTIKLIIDNYPLKSITDLTEPWKKSWIKIGGKTYSLDNIENNIIRPTFNDPRAHFALVCAAKSCPKLLNEAYMASKLNSQLDKQAKYFINNTSKNTLTSSEVQISQIFQWYEGDFIQTQTLIEYINKYANTKLKNNANISYLEYSWALNE